MFSVSVNDLKIEYDKLIKGSMFFKSVQIYIYSISFLFALFHSHVN
jgi:hypothetical protein